jgi:undecaprenyl diphosphate synthase
MSDNNIAILPTHLGIILDGNRRWANKRGLRPIEGHKQGFETFRSISEECLNRGIKFLTVYAFSTENWKRSKEEVGFLINFIGLVIDKHVKELHKKNVRFIWLGSEEGLEQSLINKLRNAEKLSKDNTKATFCLCFNYGGQQEIATATQDLALSNEPITVDSINKSLYGGSHIPPLDLVIRTSGEKRISNFMLWRCAYSELYFSDKLWPDFSIEDLNLALSEYTNRNRRYGN